MCTSQYEPNVPSRYEIKSKVKSITENQYTDTIQITFENGDRIWFTPRLSTSEMGIKPKISIEYIKYGSPMNTKSIGE